MHSTLIIIPRRYLSSSDRRRDTAIASAASLNDNNARTPQFSSHQSPLCLLCILPLLFPNTGLLVCCRGSRWTSPTAGRWVDVV